MVPFCWESLAAWGEADAAGNDNYFSREFIARRWKLIASIIAMRHDMKIGWYRRTVTIPANEHWKNKSPILTIGAADFITDCWCNGKHLGRNEGGYTSI